MYQVVWKLLKDTICDNQGQRPPPVRGSWRKSKRKMELDNRVKEVVRKKWVSFKKLNSHPNDVLQF